MAERVFIGLLVATNLIAGFGGAVLLAKQLGKISDRPRTIKYFVLLVIVYFLECVAFTAGMATQIFSVGLAFVWGIILGLWLRGRAAPREILKTSFLFSLYTTLPTATFSILLLIVFAVGRSIISIEQARDFGIPDFVPWPLNTVLGFCAALLVGTAVLKATITTGEVGLLIHLDKAR